MELREGYKKTEVGIIPNEWTPKTYGELFQFLTTSSFSRDELSEEGDVRCVHYGDIHTKYHQFLDFKTDFNSFIDLDRGKKYPFVKDGDIIMADASEDYSGIGKSVEIKNLGDKLAISGLHTFLLRDKNGDFEDGFKAYIHSMTPVKKSMDRLATGLKVYGVSKANLKTILIPVPPPKEQNAIATALSDVDSLTTNLDKLISKKRAIKQGAMQRLLKSPEQGGQRLPGFNGKWIEKSLDENSILKARIGWQGLTTEEYLDQGDYFLITGTNFKSGFIDWDNCHFVEKDRYDQDSYIQSQVNDILITKDGTIGKVAFINYLPKPATLNSGVFVVRPKRQSYHPEFMYHIFMSSFFKEFLSQLSAGSTINHLYQKDFVHFKCYLPPTISEQESIAKVLSDMDKEIESLEIKKSKYLGIKQGMMQELLTGKTRLV